MITIDAILLGGGVGRRFSEPIDSKENAAPKQFQIVLGRPVWIHALQSLCKLGCVRQAIFTVPIENVSLANSQLSQFFADCPIPLKIVPGGIRRQDSSRIALEALETTSPPPTRVLIHDACRPFLSAGFLTRIRAALFDRSYGAWIPIVPVIETLKKVEQHQVLETVDRSLVQRVQTPQIFEFSVIRSLVEKTRDRDDLNFTDDASLCEYYGIPVGTFEGDVRNIKLTYDFELESIRSMLEKESVTNALVETTCASESGSTFTV